MLPTWLVSLFVLVILAVLGSGAFNLLKGSRPRQALLKSLIWRIVLSLCLFLIILMGWVFNAWQPNAHTLMLEDKQPISAENLSSEATPGA